MTTVFVQFADASETEIIAVFACAQNTAAFPNQAQIDERDARYQAYVNPASTLQGAINAQLAALTGAYQAAIQQPVSFTTAGGVTKTFQADTDSQNVLLIATTGYSLAGATPSGFYWVSSDNTQVPFALADLKGLYAVMLAQGNVAFQKLQALKVSVRAATTVAAAQAVSW
ncbi:DUF4376 domain-containing protein [Paraburkholderia sp. Ac-20342]|uniref:DUF4376 domain-containing protein n=1 Tax=Paraburkholderia sp. Ac-20342 TaxID=2703889 RepID=UPI0019802514|nr:DUF4376 domain-containing protein [Paraburkholderia sp. Ac-20342]MBN3848611.1 DUF4376 domain-containing protein [Paraburkholderia sp. Ac-20342]